MTDLPLKSPVTAVRVRMNPSGSSAASNEMGMRAMQARAYARRGEPYLLIKSPPASGKSRALMFIALDKLHNQGLKKALVVVPERSIGGSFNNESLSKFGFWADWTVDPRWNLCNAPGGECGPAGRSKIRAVGEFLNSEDRILVCTHATFRFALDDLGVEALDDCLVAVDEFHHVSADADNRLGAHLTSLIARDKAHIVAMTGSYFRGDSVPVLSPEDEARFETVTYTYYEQLNGYTWLKELDLGYYFYSGRYLDAIMGVLDPDRKTIVHIPSVTSGESTKDKYREAEEIMNALGGWQGIEDTTGFHKIRRPDGCILKIADLVEDDPQKRDKVMAALKDPNQKNNRDHVDVILALGMAKEGFDWIWCEHALTVGYRSSLTEVVQIIGRATRDAPNKTRARFTNLIVEPDASEGLVSEAVNDTLKAIAASLLMEQVLAPRFTFVPKASGPQDGFDYGEGGYDPNGINVGLHEETAEYLFEVKGLAVPKSPEARRIVREDLNDILTTYVQKKEVAGRLLFDDEAFPEVIAHEQMGKIVRDRYPDLTAEDQEAVRQQAVAALALVQEVKRQGDAQACDAGPDGGLHGSMAFIDGVRRFITNVRDLEIDMIEKINPFQDAYAILSKAMNESTLRQVEETIRSKKDPLSLEEARELAKRALLFKQDRGRAPDIKSGDPWERRMAEGVAFLKRDVTRQKRGSGGGADV